MRVPIRAVLWPLLLALSAAPLIAAACASEKEAAKPAEKPAAPAAPAAAPATPAAPAAAARTPQPPAPGPSAPKQWSAPPAMTIDRNRKYTATIKTSKGTLVADLFATDAPATVNNFVFLAREGFYGGVKFHRIVKDFMVQTGDPLGTGTGGPGYRFQDEPVKRGYVRGTLAMANAGPNTNGSQFFIIHKDYPLPPNYTVFGVVTQGLDVLDAIATTPVRSNPFGEVSQPTETVTIQSVEIAER